MSRSINTIVNTIAASFAALAVLCALGAPAVADESPYARAGEPHGVVSGTIDRPGQQLFAVNITEVDGKRTTRERGVWLKPGRHTINAKAPNVDLGRSGGLIRSVGADSRREGNEIELEIEAGKTYWIALDASADDRDEWKLVNWRAEGPDED
ncbi:MAG: hypothetical protein WD397_02470 [Wenzhouxiangellaceae bacterium]